MSHTHTDGLYRVKNRDPWFDSLTTTSTQELFQFQFVFVFKLLTEQKGKKGRMTWPGSSNNIQHDFGANADQPTHTHTTRNQKYIEKGKRQEKTVVGDGGDPGSFV